MPLSLGWKPKDVGRRERRKLFDLFESIDPQVLISEFKEMARDVKWFQRRRSDDAVLAYLQVQECDRTTYMSSEEALNQIGNLFNWNESKRNNRANAVKDLCFQCSSTTVVVDELLNAIAKEGSFGPAPVAGELPLSVCKMPLRGEPPCFLSLDVWVNKNPLNITWCQLRAYYDDYYRFINHELRMDDIFWALQERAYGEMDAKLKASSRAAREEQICSLAVPFIDFYREITSPNYTQDAAFWESVIGRQWKTQACAEENAPTVITWEKVYEAAHAMRPQLLSIADAFARQQEIQTRKEMEDNTRRNSASSRRRGSESGFGIEAGAGLDPAAAAAGTIAAATLVSAAAGSVGQAVKSSLQNAQAEATDAAPAVSVPAPKTNNPSAAFLSTLKSNFASLMRGISSSSSSSTANATVTNSTEDASAATTADSTTAPSTVAPGSIVARVVQGIPPPPPMTLSALRKSYPRPAANTNTNSTVATPAVSATS